MKKITAILVCLLLVASLAVTAFAADPVVITVTPAKTTVANGETIDFSVTMTELANCRSAGITLTYDEAVFEYVSGACTLTGTTLANFGVIGGKLSGSFAFAAGTTVSGEIFTFKMKVKADAPLADTTIEVAGSARNVDGAVETTLPNVNMTVACEHEWSDWTADATNHSRTCSKCGTVDSAAHVAGEAQYDENNHWNICICGYHVNEAAHAHATEWSANATNHWHACDCGSQADAARHNFDEGVVTVEPTETTTGLKVYTCQTCAYVKEVTIPRIGNSNTGDNMIIAFVALMVLSATGIAVTVIGKKRAAR